MAVVQPHATDDRAAVRAEPWDGRQTGVRLLLRLAGTTAGGYLLVSGGAFGGRVWIAALSGVALAAMYALVFLRNRQFDRWPISLTVAMMVSGAAVAPYLQFLTLYFVVIGGIILVGQPQLSLRVSIPLAAVPGLVLTASSYVASRSWPTVLASLLGFVVIALIGINRRQSRQRERQDRELVVRSRELERRSQQLIAQTERTQHEMARSAALEERSRIARDIHDVLAHSLGGLVVQLDAVDALLTSGSDPEAAATRLRASRQLAVDGLREAKKAVEELQASDGDAPTDLVAALAALLGGPVATQLQLGLDLVGEPFPVPARVSSAFSSVCREAVTNLNKHAPDGPATLSLIFEPETVVLELVNGAAGRRRTALEGTGAMLGLAGMRSRMAEIGGSLVAGLQGSRWVVRAEWSTR